MCLVTDLCLLMTQSGDSTQKAQLTPLNYRNSNLLSFSRLLWLLAS